MEGALGSDDHRLINPKFVVGILACKLDGTLISLGARVTKESPATTTTIAIINT